MIRHLQYLRTAGIVALAIQSIGQPALAETITVPPVPSEIVMPAGNTAFLKGNAVGTQNYICLPSATGVAWTLFGPQATLYLKFKLFNIDIVQQITTHFLSPNPDENGMPRPTWQSSLDTSAVWGKGVKSSTDSNFVAPGAIPWLLVQVMGQEPGPTGGTMLTPATYIHRLNTSGGVAPSTGCSAATNVGVTAHVPYTADYFFYKAGQ